MADTDQTRSYRIVRALLTTVARLPMWVLYGISDIFFVTVCYLARYRRKIVTRNLQDSFPDLPAKEIRRIRRQFYRNFTDYIFETIKLFHISDDEMRRRMTFGGIENVDRSRRDAR